MLAAKGIPRVIAILLAILFPWPIKRRILSSLCGYKIHPSSWIGCSIIAPDELVMEANSKIGHLTICKGLSLLHLGTFASIGRGNWITAFPKDSIGHYATETGRRPRLLLGHHAAITHRHLIDCTDEVCIGAFSTIAGYQTQFLTHSIDIEAGRQRSRPIVIGEYCFVGTQSVLLGGSVIPSFSVLGAKSLLADSFVEPYWLYGGVPAKPIKPLNHKAAYFCRAIGHVE